LAVKKAEAYLKEVAYEVAGLHATYHQARTELLSANRNVVYFRNVLSRRQRLVAMTLISAEISDKASDDLQAAKERVQKQISVVAKLLTQLGGDPNIDVKVHPKYLSAKIALMNAELNLAKTVISAPQSGQIGQLNIEPGEYARAGVPLFTVTAAGPIWVEANLKETDLTHVAVGQAATITADAFPDGTVKATVASIGAATGSEFSILPPQNATGNWVKVVQRLPVRLKFDTAAQTKMLRAGMSVRVIIDTKFERPLPNVVQQAFALFELEK